MANFNVGDRVKSLVDFCWVKKGNEYTVTILGSDGEVWLQHEGLGAAYMTDNELELVPSALTIEAGKYYRTSDGRKVGPMVEYSHRRYCEVQGDGRWWDAKGVGCMYAKDINLIAEWVELERVAATIAIVAVIENGQPKPSSHPHMHPTRSAAEAEATRLAAKHLGKEFGVFELVASRKDERQFDHEWQRIAANGNKIGAIKAIRVLTGFGLKAAKDGIEDWLARNAA